MCLTPHCTEIQGRRNSNRVQDLIPFIASITFPMKVTPFYNSSTSTKNPSLQTGAINTHHKEPEVWHLWGETQNGPCLVLDPEPVWEPHNSPCSHCSGFSRNRQCHFIQSPLHICFRMKTILETVSAGIEKHHLRCLGHEIYEISFYLLSVTIFNS